MTIPAATPATPADEAARAARTARTAIQQSVERSLGRDGGRSCLTDTLHGRQPGQDGALLS